MLEIRHYGPEGKQRDFEIAMMLHGDRSRRIYVNYPIKGYTRKVRSSKRGLYQIVNSPASYAAAKHYQPEQA